MISILRLAIEWGVEVAWEEEHRKGLKNLCFSKFPPGLFLCYQFLCRAL